MNIFILLALVLGASASSENCPTAKDLCAGRVKCVLKCPCLSILFKVCPRFPPLVEFFNLRETEVELSAVDTLEALLARRGTDTGVECCLAGTCRDFSQCITGRDFSMCARNPNTSRCRLIKEMYCQRNPDSSDCTPRCCPAGITAECLACVAGMTEEKYCAKNPDFHGCKTEVKLSALDTLEALLARTAGTTKDSCAENPNTSRCRTIKEKFCARNPGSLYCTPLTQADIKKFCARNQNFASYCASPPGWGAEVKLSAVDTLEALLARRFIRS